VIEPISRGFVAEDMHIGVLMFIANRAAETRVSEAVHRAGYSEITLAQARIGARIAPEGTRLTELAEQAQISKQTATHLIDQLERGGYVERTVDPTDGRGRLVRFTKKGSDVIRIAREEEAKIDDEWTAHLGTRQMRQLREALTKLRDITDPYA
jgi:DNA-binding MarR family transcriptional regulator